MIDPVWTMPLRILVFARCNVLQQHSKQVQAFREQYSHHKRSRGQCDKYEARKLKSNSYKCEDGLPTTNSQCLSHHAAEKLGIFLRSWSKKSPALQSVLLQSWATTDIPVFKLEVAHSSISSSGPDDLLQMQQRWEGENHREAKCRKTNRRETKCRNGSVEKQNVESVHGNHGNHPNCTAVTTFLTIRFRKLFDLIWQQPDGDHGGYCLR